MKYTEHQLNQMEAVEIYKLVLTGHAKKFPKGFWERPEAEENAVKVIKFLFEEILKWNDEEIKSNLTKQLFETYKLKGMIISLFSSSATKAFTFAYPNRFKYWEFKCASKGYWNEETTKEAVQWLIEEKLKWSDEDIKRNLNNKIFQENGLRGLLSNYFKASSYLAINHAYPNKFKPWELPQVPLNYWNLDTAKKATKWLLEDKLKWNDKNIKNSLNIYIFRDNNLGGMIDLIFKGSTYKAIDNAYPNRFKPWELQHVPRNYWTLDTAKESVKWLIEEKLKWNDSEVEDNLSTRVFNSNGLGSMLDLIFEGSTYKALDYTYPNKFKKEDLLGYPGVKTMNLF